VLLATIAVAAIGCDVVSVYAPHSSRARVGSSVEEIVNTDCGLDGMSFDIDGSLWVPTTIDPAERAGTPPGFAPDQDIGTLTLASADQAQYRTSLGRVVPLTRLPGEFRVADADC